MSTRRLVLKLLYLVTLISLIFTEVALGKHTDTEIEQFMKLYESKVDQWSAKHTQAESDCFKGIVTYFDTIFNETQHNMFQQSFHGLNDLGNKQMCNSIPDSSYVVMNFNISTTPVALRFGLCLPDTCMQDEYDRAGSAVSESVTNLIRGAVNKFGIDIYIVPPDTTAEIAFVSTDEWVQTQWLDQIIVGTWLIATLLAMILICVCWGSIHVTRGGSNPIPIGLSIQNSSRQLVKKIQPIDDVQNMKDLKLIDGMRVLCVLWVICLGVCQSTMTGGVFNPWTLEFYFATFAYTAVYSSNLGFDEFFFLSTFLATVKITRMIREQQDKKLTLKMYGKLIAYRYLRLAPAYYLIFLFGWLVVPFFGDGPCWFTYDKGFNNCDTYWWSVFTMTINFFPSYVIANEGCFFWGWYVATDLQIFLFIPWIVYGISRLTHNWQKYSVMTFGVLVGMAINFTVIWVNEMAAGLFAPQDVLIFKIFVNKPYTKIHAVFMGMILGHLFEEINKYKSKKQNHISPETLTTESPLLHKLDKKWWPHILGYLISATLIGYTTLAPLPANMHPTKWTNFQNSAFICFSRPCFLLGLMIPMLSMFMDKGNKLRWILGVSLWRPLAALSFMVYLIFPIVNSFMLSNMPEALYLTYVEMIYLLFFNMISNFIVAYVFYLLIQGPITQTLMYLFGFYSPPKKHLFSTLKHIDQQPNLSHNSEGGDDLSASNPMLLLSSNINVSEQDVMSQSSPSQVERQTNHPGRIQHLSGTTITDSQDQMLLREDEEPNISIITS